MQEIFVTLAPYLAAGIPAALFVRWLIRDRREMRELERVARCGPGCICAGERIRQQQQQPSPIVIQQQQPMMYQQPTPQIIVLQAPAPAYQPQPTQPQVIYLPAQQPQYLPEPQQPLYLPVPQPAYQPQPQPQAEAPISYYPGPSPIVEAYEPTPEVRCLPHGEVRYLPLPSTQEVEELRRRFEKEKRAR